MDMQGLQRNSSLKLSELHVLKKVLQYDQKLQTSW